MMRIHIENLCVAFAGRRVLNNLSFSIPSGGPSFLLGPSGSGKTTLLRAINRLNECLPECVTHGQVRLQLGGRWIDAFAGRSLADPAPAQWAVQKDGGVFDQFTGATITPRAVTAAVKRTLQYFEANRAALLAPAATGSEARHE